MSSLSFEPLISPALWVTLAVVAGVFLLWYGWRRPVGVPRRRWASILVFMSLGVVVLLVVLLNPTWVVPIAPPTGKPQLTLLVDASASMATPDAAQGKTRFQAAAALAEACRKEFENRIDVRILTFTERTTAAGPGDLAKIQPQGEITDLATGLRESIDESRPQAQAVVVFSDGIHNADPGTGRIAETVRLARALGCPLHTCTLGGATDVKDVAVETRSPQELAFIKQKVPLLILLKQHGYNGAKARVVLSQDGKDLDKLEVNLSPSRVQELRFMVGQEKAGLYRYDVRIEPLQGEATQVNNACSSQLRVMDKPVRVLLLEGKPYWDTKFLQRTLLQDPSLDVDSLVRVTSSRYYLRHIDRPAPGKNAKAPAVKEEQRIIPSFTEFLAQGEGLKAYQILVLGRDADAYLDENMLGQIRTWLARDGGSLVCARGQPMAQVNQLLAALMPVRWTPASESRFRISLTERSRDLRWFSEEAGQANDTMMHLPTLASTAQPNQPQPLAVVLATSRTTAGSETPAVTFQPYGGGRVVVVEGTGMWRWAFLPTQQQELDEVYRSLWHSLLRWLVSSVDLLPGQDLALRSDKISYRTREPVTATLLLRDSAAKAGVPAVELRDTDNRLVRTVTPSPHGDEPGTYRVPFGILPEGRYHAGVKGLSEAAATTSFDVRNLLEEQLDLNARPDLMARIATDSGGMIVSGEAPKGLIDQLKTTLDRHDIERVQRLTAWDRWWWLLLLFSVWVTAWVLRRSAGLV